MAKTKNDLDFAVGNAAKRHGETQFYVSDALKKSYLFYRREMISWVRAAEALDGITPRTLKILGDFREYLIEHMGYAPPVATDIVLRRMYNSWSNRQERPYLVTMDNLIEDFSRWTQYNRDNFNDMTIGRF